MENSRLSNLGRIAACLLLFAAAAHAQFLSAIQATSSQTSVVITWTSCAPATAQVKYGTTSAYGSTSVLDPTLSTSHVANLTALAPGMLYHFEVISFDAAGQLVVSSDLTFTTLSPPPPPPSPLVIDTVVFGDRSSPGSSIASSPLSTSSANELLLALVGVSASSAGQTVTGVNGGGLTWTLAKRTNVQLGTAEVWRAIAPTILSNVTVTANLAGNSGASITVITFTGADLTTAIGATASANSAKGAPTGSLTTTRAGSWVLAAGNDWDSATSRTVGTGQTLIHQYLAASNDTYWAQRQTLPNANAGTFVTINDTAPVADRFNLSLVEVLPSLTTPPPPTHSATLSWTTILSGATFEVLRGNVMGGPYTSLVIGLTSPTYVDQAVNSGDRLFYVVDQSTASGKSGYSNEVEADIP